MTIFDLFSSDKTLTLLAGLAGAAAMATVDYSTWTKFTRHIFVGALSSWFATPILFPLITKILALMSVSPQQHEYSSAFVVGACGIYVFEFLLALWKKKGAEK